MPNLKHLTTMQLLAEFDQYMLQQEVAAIVTELKEREIKENDEDDTPQHRGGIRPEQAPRN